MTWQANLMSNIITVGILLALAIIIYCKVTNTTLKELILSIREAMAEPVDYE